MPRMQPLSVLAFAAVAACSTTRANTMDHSDHEATTATTSASAAVAPDASLPAPVEGARARLAASTRHGEWVMVPAGKDSVRAWIVYPERKTKAPVVVVIHEIFGLSPWIRGVTDQLAADGFIAIAPDLLTSKNLPNPTDSVPSDQATAAIRTLNPDDVHRQILATANYAMALPAAVKRYGVVGFCWGGSASFEHAVRSPSLGASVVYYGTSPKTESLAAIKAPVLGLYAGNDARVDATVPAADTAMRALGKTYVIRTYEGAGHGFVRQQGASAANLSATQKSWPEAIAWFRKYLGR